ncbi:hypothetical protein Efla_006901 [Eimeria flavescens]
MDSSVFLQQKKNKRIERSRNRSFNTRSCSRHQDASSEQQLWCFHFGVFLEQHTQSDRPPAGCFLLSHLTLALLFAAAAARTATAAATAAAAAAVVDEETAQAATAESHLACVLGAISSSSGSSSRSM